MTDAALKKLIDEPAMLMQLIGLRVRYLGEEFEVVDLLVEEGLVILSSSDDDEVQEDCYGRPSRLVPRCEQLHFRDPHGQPTSIWQEMVFLDGPLPGL